jgi:hypothetical protein
MGQGNRDQDTVKGKEEDKDKYNDKNTDNHEDEDYDKDKYNDEMIIR